MVDTTSYKALTHFNVSGRPSSVDFSPDSSKAFIPSESSGQLHVIDAVNHKPLKTVTLPPTSRPMCVKVAPDGKKAYVRRGEPEQCACSTPAPRSCSAQSKWELVPGALRSHLMANFSTRQMVRQTMSRWWTWQMTKKLRESSPQAALGCSHSASCKIKPSFTHDKDFLTVMLLVYPALKARVLRMVGPSVLWAIHKAGPMRWAHCHPQCNELRRRVPPGAR